MGTFKKVTELIIDWFEGNGNINEVTHGDSNQVDLTSITDFPLTHIIYTTTTYNDGYNIYNYTIQLLDKYYDNVDDRIEVLDLMNEVATQFIGAATDGSLFNSQIRNNITPNGTIIYDQYQNRLYGVSIAVGLIVPNGLSNCGR